MKNRFSRLTALGMLTALVVVLQTAATFIRFGSFPITLTLIPIVVWSERSTASPAAR
jgi:thiamine transporter ThiT